MRTKNAAVAIFDKTPGSELGNMPEASLAGQGNVTVEVGKVIPASRYLGRFYKVTGTRASRFPNSIVIDIEIKPKKATA